MELKTAGTDLKPGKVRWGSLGFCPHRIHHRQKIKILIPCWPEERLHSRRQEAKLVPKAGRPPVFM